MNILTLIRTRGQKNVEPFIVGSYSRAKEARGQCRAQRNSLFNLLMEKYEFTSYEFCYFEWRDYYAFTIEDADGIYIEAHVYLEE